jgi:hypothetical protein
MGWKSERSDVGPPHGGLSQPWARPLAQRMVHDYQPLRPPWPGRGPTAGPFYILRVSPSASRRPR